jgi:hypothetical protein
MLSMVLLERCLGGLEPLHAAFYAALSSASKRHAFMLLSTFKCFQPYWAAHIHTGLYACTLVSPGSSDFIQEVHDREVDAGCCTVYGIGDVRPSKEFVPFSISSASVPCALDKEVASRFLSCTSRLVLSIIHILIVCDDRIRLSHVVRFLFRYCIY